MTNRHAQRTQIQAQRRQLTLPYQLRASQEVCRYIANTPWFQNSTKIAFYMTAGGELDPAPLLAQAASAGKICYLPILHPEQHNVLWFLRYTPGDPLKANKYGILEPLLNRDNYCAPEALDLVFTPLVAFDHRGNRLGSGKGYYDRTFAFMQRENILSRPKLVGLAYDFQEVAEIQKECWDIPLEKIIAFSTPGNLAHQCE